MMDNVAKCEMGIAALHADNERLASENARLRENIRHCQGRFLNINITLSSGGSKIEAIQIAYIGEDCCKGYLEYGQALGDNHG
jgi:hypothetical protein